MDGRGAPSGEHRRHSRAGMSAYRVLHLGFAHCICLQPDWTFVSDTLAPDTTNSVLIACATLNPLQFLSLGSFPSIIAFLSHAYQPALEPDQVKTVGYTTFFELSV
jgi:hypothetical protein